MIVKDDDVIKNVLEYVKDERYCQAVLIDGKWGAGKTFFVKEKLLTKMKEELLSDGTLWEGQIALYFRWTCLPDCAVPELDADYRRNNRRLS